MNLIGYAVRCLRAGISLLPIRRDGSKAPADHLLPEIYDEDKGGFSRSWKPLQERPIEVPTAYNWWDNETPPGIAAICGEVSGGLELIDFDTGADVLFPQWCKLVEEQHPGVLSRVCVHRTPRLPVAYHVWFVCGNICTPGSQKLAWDPTRPSLQRTLIETRGEGGYALLPYCPPECHKTLGLYTHHSGRQIYELPDLSMDERDTLIGCARYLDRTPPEPEPTIPTTARRGRTGDEIRPGEDFDRRGPDWADILTPHGWTLAHGSGGERRWRRPGKTHGWSATTGHCKDAQGNELLRVFSGNAYPLEEGKTYGKFRAYAFLNHSGDLSAAASELGKQGFGSAPRKPDSPPPEIKAPSIPTVALPPLESWKPFPIDALPEVLRRFCTEGAEALGCDPAYPALFTLAVVGGAIGTTRAIRLKRSWTESPIVWSCVIGDSGSMKSPAFRLCVSPMRRIQTELIGTQTLRLAAWRDQHDAWEEACKEARKNKEESPAEPPKPVQQRVVVSDITIERLAEILEENPRGILVERDELDGWIGGFTRYKNKGGTDLPNWLSLHNAGTITVDRKTGDRRLVHVEHASASVTGGIQPGVLVRSLTREFFDSGFVARLLLAWPPKTKKRWTEAEISSETEDDYMRLLRSCLRMSMARNSEGHDYPKRIEPTAEAHLRWTAFYDEWAEEQVSAEGETASVYSKLEAYVPRLALIHHIATMLAADLDDSIHLGVESIDAGITMVRWFAREILRIYTHLNETEDQRDLRRLLTWIEAQGGITTARKLMRSNNRKYPTRDNAEAVLCLLVQGGLGVWHEVTEAGRSVREFHLRRERESGNE